MRQIFMALLMLFSSFMAQPCFSKCDPSLIREAVLEKGMSIKAETKFGIIEIRAGEGCERTFTWENKSYTVELIPRRERWYGNFGLYHPQMRPPHKNVVHMVAEEYQLNFNSEQEAVQSINKRGGLYNDEGFYVNFIKRDGPGGEDNIFIMVTVSRILINGQKIKELQGSTNKKVKVIRNT